MKILLEGLKSILELAEERISKLNDRPIEIMQFEKEREKKMERDEQSPNKMWNTNHTNIPVMGEPKGKERKST